MLVEHVYNAPSEEMQAGAGRAVTLGIRALGCVVNLGRDNTYMRARICDYFGFQKLYMYIILVV